MTQVEKAYDYAMGVLEELKKSGVKVKMIIPRRVKEGKYHDTVIKYHPPKCLPVEKWRHVELFPKKRQVKLVHDAVSKLFEFGITFDTGGGCKGGRDWEIDWSFTYNKEKNTEALESLQENEELIRELF
jgi:hypothetical protein